MKQKLSVLFVAALVTVFGATSGNAATNSDGGGTPATTAIVGTDDVVAIAGGEFTNYCTIRYGVVWCSSKLPYVSGLPATPVSIAAGREFQCAIVVGGSLWCWGENGTGELGNNADLYSPSPVPVYGFTDGVSAVTAGDLHTCSIRNSGAWCWGQNVSGELGMGVISIRSLLPVPVQGFDSGVTEINAGVESTCAVRDGGAWCWGENVSGQLGNDSTTRSPFPVPVSGLATGVTTVAVGFVHACAVKEGSAWCWGQNDSGELGTGTTTPSRVPVAVPGLESGVTEVSAAFYATCALKDGGVWCWGQSHLSPQPVFGLEAGVSSLSVGLERSCALKNGDQWCWNTGSSAPIATFVRWDVDGDGCDDEIESGTDHRLGGARDRFDGSDFFDVPSPSIPAYDPMRLSSRNGAVGIADVIAVLTWVGAVDGGPPNASARNYSLDTDGDGVKDGAEYDRTASTTSGQAWRSGPPDGAVSIQDVIVALAQVGDRCAPSG